MNNDKILDKQTEMIVNYGSAVVGAAAGGTGVSAWD
jgi:hypothetical protein